MTITIGIWIIPAMLTIFIWIWFASVDVGSGYIGPIFELATAIIGTLFIWLVYFSAIYFAAGWGMI